MIDIYQRGHGADEIYNARGRRNEIQAMRKDSLIITYRYARKIAAFDLSRKNDPADSRRPARQEFEEKPSSLSESGERGKERGSRNETCEGGRALQRARQQQRATARSVIKSSRFPFIFNPFLSPSLPPLHHPSRVCMHVYVHIYLHLCMCESTAL